MSKGITIYISDIILEKLDEKAVQEQRSRSNMLNKILTKYLSNGDSKQTLKE